MTDRELINIAVEASEKAYAPYSKFAVGAALECDDGTVFTGCNIENAAYGCTNCAERTAVFKAVSEGKREFRRIAIFADTEEYCMPCGTCRQVLSEFCKSDFKVIFGTDDNLNCITLNDILPYSFSLL